MAKTSLIKPKEHKYPLRKCKGCPMVFYPDRQDQVYHNGKCREDNYLKTYYKKTEVTKVCKYEPCGCEFQTSKPKLQDYCEPAHRKAAALQRAHDKESEYQKLKMEAADK